MIGPVSVGPAAGIPLIAVASHDTASAVVGTPLKEPGDVYLSSGTWSLIGMELDSPVLTEESCAANLTNEGGVDATIRFLKNIMGMWIISEAVREWRDQGLALSVPELAESAMNVSGAPHFDATDPVLLPPGDMIGRVKALVGDDERMDDPVFFTRSVMESLADAYADAVKHLAHLTGRSPSRIAIVGGGSNNRLLCQLTADRTRLQVTAGPAEATALGNALIQARAVGLIPGGLTEIRRTVMSSTDITSYLPTPQRPGQLLAELAGLSNEFGMNPAFVRAGGVTPPSSPKGCCGSSPVVCPWRTWSPVILSPWIWTPSVPPSTNPTPTRLLVDPINQIAVRTRLDDGPRRPSVELLFHALIPRPTFCTTHPITINAVTCNADGEG